MGKRRASLLFFPIVSALAALSGACGNNSVTNSLSTGNGPADPACTYTSANVTECILYSDSTSQSTVNASCTSSSGATSATCSTTNLLGTCSNITTPSGGIIYYYEGGSLTTISGAETLCTNAQGTFTAY